MAWTIVGVGTSVEVTTTAHALTVPAGVAAGDLLVACIASRIASTTSITLPTGGEWTLVSEQKANNVLTTSSALPSAMMAYCVRGASNPNLTFTHPTAPAPALGRIVAYRGGVTPTASAKDTQTSFTTAINVTAVSGTGLTTTAAGDLIVAMAAGGQEAAWSSFDATTPSGASGATDATTAPSATWRERADVQTTTGNDTSLGIFDALKTAAGATGNLIVTASVAAGHSIVAGAFKIAVSVSASVTGQEVTAAVGTATVAGKANATVTGQAVTASTGTATVSLPIRADVTGQQIAVSVDAATVTAKQNISTTVAGQEVAASTGTISVMVPFIGARSYIVGSPLGGAYVSETGSISYAIPAGYVSETYAAGVSVSVNVTGQAVTAAVGDAIVSIPKVVDVTGQSAAISVGSVTVSAGAGATVSVTGQEATVSAGTVTVTANRTALVDVTGQALTTSVGSVTVSAGAAPATVTSREYIVGSTLGATFVSETGARSYAISSGYVTETASALAGVSVWNGSAWVQKPAKVWTGSAWVQKPVKTWNGTSWAA